MQNITLTCNNVSTFPFPEKVKNIISLIDWEKIIWQGMGQLGDGKYNLIDGKTLYYESDVYGNIKVQKSDFCGLLEIACFLLNPIETDENNYFLIFNLLFNKGEVIENIFIQYKEFNKKSYQQMTNNIKVAVGKIYKIKNSWWYKYIYVYYAFIIRLIALYICKFLKILHDCIVFITNLITPI